jgi:hypothetical protein
MRKKSIVRSAVLAFAMLAGTIGLASPASAAYDSEHCVVPWTSCTTDAIPAHSWDGWIKVALVTSSNCGSEDWQLKQGSTVVASGQTGRTVYNLSTNQSVKYHLYFYNACIGEQGVIANYTQ